MRDVRQLTLLAFGVMAGLLLAYVDSRPRRDDTGIIVGGLLLASGLLTLLGFRPPWLAGLVVGIWIPLHGLYVGLDFRMLLVLLFPLLGAYAGWLLRLGITKTLDTPQR